MDFETLPPELIIGILCKVPARDLASVAQTCRKFRESSLVDAIWQRKCKEDYGVGPGELEGSSLESYRLLYTRVLHPYGYLLGVWQAQMGPYGGLLKVQLEAGIITATQYFAPHDPKVFLPLREKSLFTVTYSEEEDRAEPKCVKNGPHLLKLMRDKDHVDQVFTMKCAEPEKHQPSQNRRGDFVTWIREEIGGLFPEIIAHGYDPEVNLLRMKYEKLKEFDLTCAFKRLAPPMPSNQMPLQPGLFKGTYGGHGVEIIQLTYEGNRLKGIKITGDPNVPASKVTMDVHLDQPMVLTASQQESLSTLSQLAWDSADHQRASDSGQGTQPFRLPFGVEDRGLGLLRQHTQLPLDRCSHRFFATGLIALSGFRGSSRTPAHFVVFTEDILGFVWLELRSLSVYCRVSENIWT